VEDKKLGRLTFGQQSPATDDITIISLGAKMSDAALHYNTAFDVALRYSDGPEWLRLAAGIGFMDHQELGIRDVRGSFSAFHTPTGLFATVAGGWRQDYGVTIDADRHGYFYFAQLGLTQRFLSLGKTTIYGEFGHYNDFARSTGRRAISRRRPGRRSCWEHDCSFEWEAGSRCPQLAK
jgi:hypothetical protein